MDGFNAAVVLDIDDTLFLERDYAASGFRAAGLAAKKLWGLTDFAESCQNQFECGTRGRIFNAVLDCAGIVPSTEALAELVCRYREHAPDISLLPDARDFIKVLKGKVGLAIISDGPLQAQQRKVEALGLNQLADLIVLTDSWGREFWKPHPRAYTAVEQHFGLAAGQCCYLADNPEKDFISPRRLGWYSIRVRRPEGLWCAVEAAQDCAADHEVAGLAQALAVLEPWMASPA